MEPLTPAVPKTTKGQEEESLEPFSTTLPSKVIARIKQEATANYPLKPAHIVRRIVVQHYEKCS